MKKLSLDTLTQNNKKLKEFEDDLNSILTELSNRSTSKYDDHWIHSQLNKLAQSINAQDNEIQELRARMLKLQIVNDENNKVVQFPAGGPVEADLVKIIIDSVCTGPMHIGTKKGLEDKIKKAVYKFKENILSVPIGKVG